MKKLTYNEVYNYFKDEDNLQPLTRKENIAKLDKYNKDEFKLKYEGIVT